MLVSNPNEPLVQNRKISFKPEESMIEQLILSLEQDDFNLFLNIIFCTPSLNISNIPYKNNEYSLLELASLLELPNEYLVVINRVINPLEIYIDEYDQRQKNKLMKDFESFLKDEDSRKCVQFIIEKPYMVSSFKSTSNISSSLISLAVDYDLPGVVGFLTVSGANTYRILKDHTSADHLLLPDSFTVLIKSIVLRRRDCSMALINFGAHLGERPNIKGPIYYAIELGQGNIVDSILKKIDPQQIDKFGQNLFFYLRMNLEYIFQLLIDKGLNLNQPNFLQITPFIHFIRKGKSYLVRKSILKGAIVYSENPFYSAIHEAIDYHQLRIFKLLVQLGVNPNQKNQLGENVFHQHIRLLNNDYNPLSEILASPDENSVEFKIERKNREIFNLFVINKVDFYEKNADGKTVVELAEEKGFLNLANALKLLIKLDQERKNKLLINHSINNSENKRDLIFSKQQKDIEYQDQLLRKRKFEDS